MTRSHPQSPAPGPSAPGAATSEAIEAVKAAIITERRRFPRELPKPDVQELDSDSAWQAFQASDGCDPEPTIPPAGTH